MIQSAILVYTISNDDLRKNFVEVLEKRGWWSHKDQSTLIYPQKGVPLIFPVKSFTVWFEKWSEGKPWSEKDFVHVFYPRIGSVKRFSLPVIQSVEFHKR